MAKVNDYQISLLEEWGDSVDIHYTQFLEVAFFLKVPATHKMAVAFVRRKLPPLGENEISYLIGAIIDGYHETL